MSGINESEKQMTTKIYLNGQFLPREKASISVMDRGFLFGDGVYEVIPVYGRKLFRLKQHLQRLENSLAAIHMKNPHSESEWETLLNKLIEQDPEAIDQAVYLQVTRGVAPVRDHAIPDEVIPTVFAMTRRIDSPDPEVKRQGIAAVIQDDVRWHMKSLELTVEGHGE